MNRMNQTARTHARTHHHLDYLGGGVLDKVCITIFVCITNSTVIRVAVHSLSHYVFVANPAGRLLFCLSQKAPKLKGSDTAQKPDKQGHKNREECHRHKVISGQRRILVTVIVAAVATGIVWIVAVAVCVIVRVRRITFVIVDPVVRLFLKEPNVFVHVPDVPSDTGNDGPDGVGGGQPKGIFLRRPHAQCSDVKANDRDEEIEIIGRLPGPWHVVLVLAGIDYGVVNIVVRHVARLAVNGSVDVATVTVTVDAAAVVWIVLVVGIVGFLRVSHGNAKEGQQAHGTNHDQQQTEHLDVVLRLGNLDASQHQDLSASILFLLIDHNGGNVGTGSVIVVIVIIVVVHNARIAIVIVVCTRTRTRTAALLVLVSSLVLAGRY